MTNRTTISEVRSAWLAYPLTKEDRLIMDESLSAADPASVKAMFRSGAEQQARMVKYACYVEATDKWGSMPHDTAITLAKCATWVAGHERIGDLCSEYMERMKSKLTQSA